MENIKCLKCGSEKYYVEEKANNHVARCSECKAFIKNVAYEHPKFYVGRYKGILVSEVRDLSYLKWAKKEMKISASMRDALDKQIEKLQEK